MVTPALVTLYCRILNAFENDSGSPETDYKAVYLYKDGNNKRRQVTLGRGFTDDGGNLRKVCEQYLFLGGKDKAIAAAVSSNRFGKGVLCDDKAFVHALSAAGDEQPMRDAQDQVFKAVYLSPAFNWAHSNGLDLPLSIGVVVDSYLHSGCVPSWLCKKFVAAVPVHGGQEKTWVQSYLIERLAWFKRVTGPLHNCQYRPQFFLNQIAKQNWQLNSPLVANGARVA